MANYQTSELEALSCLVLQHAPQEGVNSTIIDDLGTFKLSQPTEKTSVMDIPAIVVVAQGRKHSYLADKVYDYSVGNVIVGFYPVPVSMEVIEASPEKPFLLAGVNINLDRMSDVLLRIDRIDGIAHKPEIIDPSGIFSISLNDSLLNPFIRLFKLLASPRDAAMLSEAIIDEIYYRLLCDERGGILRFLLQQQGDIQRISKAVDHIYRNLDQSISVDELAEIVHMSRTVFYETFKSVMHLSPLQYAKSVKLYQAQKLIQGGKKANEAAYMVGYNSPVQFSREYKRHFGYSPSQTLVITQ